MSSLNYPSSSAKHVPNFYSIARCIKLYFQQVVIRPNCTLVKEVMFVLLRRCNLFRGISERAALKDFTITLHTDLQSWWFLICWKEDLMELQNNLLIAHGSSLILDEKLITTVTLHRWWWSHDFLRGMLHTYCLNKQFFPKTSVFKINWHGGVPYLSSFALGSGDSISDAGPLTKVSTYH